MIEGAPLPEVCGKGAPPATVFRYVLQDAKKSEIVDFHIASLLR